VRRDGTRRPRIDSVGEEAETTRGAPGEAKKKIALQSGPAHTLNLRIASRLDEVAEILTEQRANPYRVRAYRNAAATLRRLPQSVSEILSAGGEPAQRSIPGIGPTIARAVASLILTGRLAMLDRLRGKTDHGALLASVPGIGKVLAARLHDQLNTDTLEQLEAAAHDGRLKNLLDSATNASRASWIRSSAALAVSRNQRRRISTERLQSQKFWTLIVSIERRPGPVRCPQ
jgi:DNA polymerase/3'-5' exonuclease PolX